jgi:hypothetical protein
LWQVPRTLCRTLRHGRPLLEAGGFVAMHEGSIGAGRDAPDVLTVHDDCEPLLSRSNAHGLAGELLGFTPPRSRTTMAASSTWCPLRPDHRGISV